MAPSDHDPEAEARLLAALAAGDRDALRELYARFATPLFSLAVQLLGDAGGAEEAVQDTFVKIWRHAPAYDARKSRPFTWAVTILRRTCVDQLRRRPRGISVSLPPADHAPDAFTAGEEIRRTAEGREQARHVQAALAAFAPPQRDALELALFSTLSHAEIARRLSQPLGTVKSWIRRGLLDLRATLDKSVL